MSKGTIKIKAADWLMIIAALKDARERRPKPDKATLAQLTRIIDQIEDAFAV